MKKINRFNNMRHIAKVYGRIACRQNRAGKPADCGLIKKPYPREAEFCTCTNKSQDWCTGHFPCLDNHENSTVAERWDYCRSCECYGYYKTNSGFTDFIPGIEL